MLPQDAPSQATAYLTKWIFKRTLPCLPYTQGSYFEKKKSTLPENDSARV